MRSFFHFVGSFFLATSALCYGDSEGKVDGIKGTLSCGDAVISGVAECGVSEDGISWCRKQEFFWEENGRKKMLPHEGKLHFDPRFKDKVLDVYVTDWACIKKNSGSYLLLAYSCMRDTKRNLCDEPEWLRVFSQGRELSRGFKRKDSKKFDRLFKHLQIVDDIQEKGVFQDAPWIKREHGDK